MKKLVGIFHDKNRLQVYLTLIVFSFCAWWSLNPLGFHLLDGLNIAFVMMLGSIVDVIFPFNAAVGWSEVIFLLVNSIIPVTFYMIFSRNGSKFMASCVFFWVAYAFQNWFRFFHLSIYRIPAVIALCLCLLFLYVGLIACLKNSEGDEAENYMGCFDEIAALESENGEEFENRQEGENDEND